MDFCSNFEHTFGADVGVDCGLVKLFAVFHRQIQTIFSEILLAQRLWDRALHANPLQTIFVDDCSRGGG